MSNKVKAKDVTVVMTLKDFKKYVKHVEREARLDELSRIQPLGNGSYIRGRTCDINGDNKVILQGVKKSDRRSHVVLRVLNGRQNVPSEFSALRQYLVDERD